MANAFSTVPSGWWEDGSTVAGTDLRRGMMQAQVAGGTTPLGVRAGVRPARGNPLLGSLPGGMVLRVQPGQCLVPAAATEGGYVITLPALLNIAVTAADGANPRIDLFGAEIVPGSPTTWRFRMVDGTPGVTPAVPSYAVAGGYFLPLAQVRVNAGVSAPTSVTDLRTFTVAPGGIVPVPGFAALDTTAQNAVCAALPGGTGVHDPVTNLFGLVTSGGLFYPIRQAPQRFRENNLYADPGADVAPGVTWSGDDIQIPASFGGAAGVIDLDIQISGRVGGATAQTVLPFWVDEGGLTEIMNDPNPERIDYEDSTVTGADWRIWRASYSLYWNGQAAVIAAALKVGAGTPHVFIHSAQINATVWL